MYNNFDFLSVIRQKPQAFAVIKGSSAYPNISGDVYFYQIKPGVIVVAYAKNLPKGHKCSMPILAFHIHSGNSCSGNENDSFADALTHYNPNNCPHPFHAGDMPPIFSNDGLAFSAFLTNRFTVSEIIGKTVIIHSSPDDFTTQPSGNSGTKIACGVIKAFR